MTDNTETGNTESTVLREVTGPVAVLTLNRPKARNALDELGHQPPLTRERYLEAIAGEDPWLGVPEPMRSDYVKLAFAYLITELDRTERLEILPHVQETLAELKRRGYIMGVVTSRPGAVRRLIEKLAMVGLAAYFDQVVTQDVDDDRISGSETWTTAGTTQPSTSPPSGNG